MAGSILSWSREQRGRSALGVQAADDFTYLIGMAGGAIVRGNIYLETKMSVGLKAVERFRLVILIDHQCAKRAARCEIIELTAFQK